MKQNQTPLKTAQQYYNRAREHFCEEEFEEAEADCTEAILRDEKFRQAWRLRGDIYSETEKYDLAVENFTQALRLLSDERQLMPWESLNLKVILLCRIAAANLARGNLEDAIRVANKSAELTESYTMIQDFAEPWYIQGMAWLKKGNLKKALYCFDDAIAKGANGSYHPESLLERAGILRALWRADEGIDDCDSVLQRDPCNADALVERACCRSAKAFQWSDEDIEDLRRAIRLSPKHSGAWFVLADCLFGIGRLEEAGEVAAKALELNLEDEKRAARLGVIMDAAQGKRK